MQGDLGSWRLPYRETTLLRPHERLPVTHCLEVAGASGYHGDPDWESSHRRTVTHVHSWPLLLLGSVLSVMALVKAEQEFTEATEQSEGTEGSSPEQRGVARPPVGVQNQPRIRIGRGSDCLSQSLAFLVEPHTVCQHAFRSSTSSFAPSGFMDPWYSCYVLS